MLDQEGCDASASFVGFQAAFMAVSYREQTMLAPLSKRLRVGGGTW